jgi:hypothetical protein
LAVLILAAVVEAAVVLVSAFGLPRCSVGRLGSFSSGDEVGGGGVAVGCCAFACEVSPPSVGCEDDEDGGDESLRVGRSESSFDAVDDEAEGDAFFSVGRSVLSVDDPDDEEEGDEFFSVGRSESSPDVFGALLAEEGDEVPLDDSGALP